MKFKRTLIICSVLILSFVMVTVALAAASSTKAAAAPRTSPGFHSTDHVVGPKLSTKSMDIADFPRSDDVLESVLNPDLSIEANYAHDWLAGFATPNDPITITVADGGGGFKATVTGTVRPDGSYFTGEWAWNPEQPDIIPGDVVTATAPGETGTIAPIGTITGELDLEADTISGTISAPWFSPLTLTVRCEVWVESGPPPIDVTGVDPDGGEYLCDFSTVGWDIQKGEPVAVRYIEPDGDSVINLFESPWMRVNYGQDWVGGNYDLGHTFWITVTDSGGAVKAAAVIATVSGGGWGADGFETQDIDWTPGLPDMMPGDWVYFQSDDGYTNTMRIGEISGTLDIDSDSVTGPIYATWFTNTLDVECHAWGAPDGAPDLFSTAAPDGSSPYTCQWDPFSEWDIQPGQDVAVMYVEPDTDRVINVFRDPAPDVWVEKWVEGSELVAPGGQMVFGIRFGNDGDASAENVVLTDTLPVSSTYVFDSNPFAVVTTTTSVIWDVGAVQPGEESQFTLVLANTANPGDILLNQVDIAALYDFNFENDHGEAQVQVTDDFPDLFVNKGVRPGDPAPGQTYQYVIDYGNNGPVASEVVILTDTLPLSTSVVSWFSDYGYNVWTDVSTSGDQLTLIAPSIPGFWGDRIVLRLQVDPAVSIGTRLTNTVEITAAGDTNLGDNWFLHDTTWVGEETWGAYLEKFFINGQLTPGGEATYHIYFENSGNFVTQAWLTDTLPAGTSFIDAWVWHEGAGGPFPPDFNDGNVVAWNIGTLETAEWYDVDVRLAIDSAITPGSSITNCAVIAISDIDEYLPDNTSCVIETIRDLGPNLRVNKYFWWNWEGTLEYEVRVDNIGSERLESVLITDTYPLSTTFDGDWWVNYGPWITITHDAPNRQLLFWVEELLAGESASVGFWANIEGAILGDQGLAFTNTVEAPIPGDVNPEDNDDQVTAYTGPDVYVEKWLSGGELKPGEIVTFTVEFGNANLAPWDGNPNFDSTITDTLPAEMTFITATAAWDPGQPWPPNILPGNVLEWGWGPMWAESSWFFEIVAQITDTVEGGDVITNVIQAYGNSPTDTEYFTDNNVFAYPMTILYPKYTIGKGYESNVVAGMPVTYTLAVTNIGTLEGNGLVITDQLPANLTYASGGTYSVTTGSIEWSLPSLNVGQSSQVQFVGVMACTSGLPVINDQYQVITSAEGVSSPFGPSVVFDILTPTITADFDQSAMLIHPGQTVYFTSTSTTNGTPLASWSWDFGDGFTGTGQTISHTYGSPGTFNVQLTVSDGCGYSTEKSVDAAVIVDYPIYLPIIIRRD